MVQKMRSRPLPSRPEIVVTLHHRTLAPSREDWDSHVAVLREAVAAAMAGDRVSVNLVFTDGPGPNVAQRRQVAAMTPSGSRARSAVVSSSPLVRGICATLSWMGLAVQAFSPENWRGALESAGITPEQTGDVRALVALLAAEVGEMPRSAEPLLGG